MKYRVWVEIESEDEDEFGDPVSSLKEQHCIGVYDTEEKAREVFAFIVEGSN